MDIDLTLGTLKSRVDGYLSGLFTGEAAYSELLRSMRYSLLAGGKRIRPILTLQFAQASGGDQDSVMPLACALELIHTYSLIHDDLPCMDNDDLRRGRPTNHVAFGECRALLAGDALQAAAFSLALTAPIEPGRLVRAVKYLADCAGHAGMCGGQELDTSDSSDRSLEGLTLINDLKTGALIKAACVLGVIAAGGGEAELRAAEGYGLHLARAFQIQDDILDMTSTPQELGKPVGSDEANNKPTYASVLGVERAQEKVLEESAAAVEALEGVFGECEFFEKLVWRLAVRKS